MIQLQNNCRRGAFNMHPSDWQTKGADLSKNWHFTYRFYDDSINASRQIRVKGGLNRYTSLTERQEAAKLLLEAERIKLEEDQYNAITGRYMKPKAEKVQSLTAIGEALPWALKKKDCVKKTKVAIQTSLNVFMAGLLRTGMHKIPAAEITKQQLNEVIENIGEFKKAEGSAWSNNYYNVLRKDMGMLFKVLKAKDIIEENTILRLEIKKAVRKIRITTAEEERNLILQHLSRPSMYSFKRFILIFFFSGARTNELLEVKKEDVDLSRMRFIVTTRKGRGGHRQEYRIINKKVLHLWQEIYAEAPAGSFLFSDGLKPQIKEAPIRAEQVTRRWKRHVKDKLGITADFYSLKHSYLDLLDETMMHLKQGLELAQEAAGHTSTGTTEIYAFNHIKRKQELLKQVNVKFA